MIMEFVEEIVYDWVGIYWFVIVWINGCRGILVVYDYGIYMRKLFMIEMRYIGL
jgi:hypothetical protein